MCCIGICKADCDGVVVQQRLPVGGVFQGTAWMCLLMGVGLCEAFVHLQICGRDLAECASLGCTAHWQYCTYFLIVACVSLILLIVVLHTVWSVIMPGPCGALLVDMVVLYLVQVALFLTEGGTVVMEFLFGAGGCFWCIVDSGTSDSDGNGILCNGATHGV